MNTSLSTLAATSGLALLAGTLHSTKQNLIHRESSRFSPTAVSLIHVAENLLWLLCVLGFITAAPHPMVVVMAALFIVSIVTTRRLRYREDQRSLNLWLRIGAQREAALPQMLEHLARGFRSRLAWQVKRCIRRLNRGASIADAARRSKMPLEADTLAAILIPSPESPWSGDPTRPRFPLDPSDSPTRHEANASLVPHQLAYIVVTVLLAWFLGMFIRQFVVPSFDDLLEEFSGKTEIVAALSSDTLDRVGTVGNLVVFVLAIWLLFAALIRWLPGWLVAWIPWFGRSAIERWRGEVFRALQRGMRSGRADVEMIRCTLQTSRVPWVRRRCRAAHRFLEAGTAFPQSLERARLVTRRERAWLACAMENGNLPNALLRLSDDLHRRGHHRWRIRMAWLVPVATVAVGVYVLAHTVFLFGFLSGVMHSLS